LVLLWRLNRLQCLIHERQRGLVAAPAPLRFDRIPQLEELKIGL
jgi:hypothetical protein